MSTAFTFDTLQTAIEAHIEDSDEDFTDSVATIIALGEDRCVKDLDFEMWYVVDASTTLSIGSRLLTLPSGSLRVGDISITVSSAYVPLEQRTYSYLLDYAPAATQVQPKYWAPYSETQIAVAGVPIAASVVTMKHLKRPTGLSDSNTTTWLSTNLGDLLFHSCLMAGEGFIKADERVAFWQGQYQQELAAAKQQFRHLMRHDYR